MSEETVSEVLTSSVVGVFLLLVIQGIQFVRTMKDWIWGSGTELMLKEVQKSVKTEGELVADSNASIGDLVTSLKTIKKRINEIEEKHDTFFDRWERDASKATPAILQLLAMAQAVDQRNSVDEASGRPVRFSPSDRKRINKIYGNVKLLIKAGGLSETELS